jgi:hypothetical protein
MRNDARPIGPEVSDQSPIDAHQSPAEVAEAVDARSPHVDRASVGEDQPAQPASPAADSTANTEIQTVDLEGREL